MARLFALALAVLLAACSAGQDGAGAPAPDGRVRDLAGILTPEEEQRLTQRLDEAERLYGPQVAIVTVKSLDGKPIEQFATDYANEWGLGDKVRNDGMLILVAPNERKVRLAIGTGIETTYPDSWANGVVNTMTEHFRQSHYNRGLAAALDMVIGRMKQFPTLPANDNAPQPTKAAA